MKYSNSKEIKKMFPVLEDFKGTVKISKDDPWFKQFAGVKRTEKDKPGYAWMEFTRGDSIPAHIAKRFPTLRSLQKAGFVGEEVFDDDVNSSAS